MVLFFARLLPDISKFNEEFKFQFSGRYAIDGIWIPIEGRQYVILIILDLESLDIVDYLVADKENALWWIQILRNLREAEESYLGNRTEFFVSDGKGGISKSLKKVYPSIPRQVCKAHKLMRLRTIYPRRKLNKFVRLWYLLGRKALSAKSYEDYIFWKKSLVNITRMRLYYKQEEVDRERLPKTLGVLNYQENDFTLQFREPELVNGVTTNNALEGVNSFLDERIKLFRGMKRYENAKDYIKLLIYFYRFHKFQSSKKVGRNGRAPVEITPCINVDGLDSITGEKSYSWIQNLSKFNDLSPQN
jgi:transposase-like protein